MVSSASRIASSDLESKSANQSQASGMRGNPGAVNEMQRKKTLLDESKRRELN